jgi:hypothetical protein
MAVEIFEKDSDLVSTLPDYAEGAFVTFALYYDNTGGKAIGWVWPLAYVDFTNLTDLTLASQVTLATCECYQSSAANSVTGRWQRCTADPSWVENSVTYNNLPYTARDAAVVSDDVVCASTGWKTWTITDMVKDAITNRASIWQAVMIGVAYTPNVVSQALFYSKEYTTDTSLRPKITITYTVSEVTFTAKIMMF